MSFTIREWTGGWRRHALAALALALFLTFLGPFQTQAALTPAPRALFWIGLVGTGYLLALAADRLIGTTLPSTPVKSFAAIVLSALPQTFIVGWALVQVRPGRIISVADLPMLFLAVASVQLLIVAIQVWLASHGAPAVMGVSQSAPSGRIARAVPGDLLALEAEDHYVRLHHSAGSSLLHHRFGDALAELEGREGLQVHRGWWVADQAVSGTFVRDGKRWLALHNGLVVPVSRSHLRRVVERDWPRIPAPASR